MSNVAQSLWSRPRCQHVEFRGNVRKHKVECYENVVEPQFTKAIKEMTAKDERQPHYYCAKHAPLYPNVSGSSGKKARRQRGTKA